MTDGRDASVALFLFNRAETLAPIIEVLRVVRPRVVFAIADGPRADRPDDRERCQAARALVDGFDWPCEVVRDFAEANMGCHRRMTSGLDWVFREVPEAIVVEDDVLPDPSFFAWCGRMLDLYRDEPRVMHITGRNSLGRWTVGGEGHCLLHRGSVWGWASWRRAWQQDVRIPGTPETMERATAESGADPLVVDHLFMLQEVALNGVTPMWDVLWELRKGLSGGLSVVPCTNLTAHIGFGAGATHNQSEFDIGALTPVGTAPEGEAADRCVHDPRLDRWTMLFELMARYREPALAWRLARAPRLAAAGVSPPDRRLDHHLAPFRHCRESLAALEHFVASGAPSELLQALFVALRRAVADETARAAALDARSSVA